MRKQRAILSSISKSGDLTDFEKSVYRAAMEIPEGEVRTYKWIAHKIGHPRSCRAVGNALNKNPFPLEVPCHRVIRSDRSIGGFARGVNAKMRLLRVEGVDYALRRCYNLMNITGDICWKD